LHVYIYCRRLLKCSRRIPGSGIDVTEIQLALS